jgi:hypothetical protein
MKKYGGSAIAVYNPGDQTRRSFRKCYQLATHADRVKHMAPSDFRAGSHLRFLLEEMILETADPSSTANAPKMKPAGSKRRSIDGTRRSRSGNSR